MSWTKEHETLQQEGTSPAMGTLGTAGKHAGYYTMASGINSRDIKDMEAGGGSLDEKEQATAVGTTNVSKLGFLRKVYGIVSLQLLLTMMVSWLCVTNGAVRGFIAHSAWTVYAGAGVSVSSLIGLHVFRQKHPMNAYLLVVWTFMGAYTIGVICASYASVEQGISVIRGEGLALVVAVGMALATFQEKIDVPVLGVIVPIAGLTILLLWSCLLDNIGLKWNHYYSMYGALAFLFWIAMKTSHNLEVLSSDKYVIACIDLYHQITIGVVLFFKVCLVDFITCRYKGYGNLAEQEGGGEGNE